MKISTVASIRALLLSVLLLSEGCVSVPLATPEDDAKAKLFESSKEKAVLYIYRTWAFMGGGVAEPLMIDDKEVAALKTGSFVRIEKEPGKVEISSYTRNYLLSFKDGIRVFPITVKAGDVIFVKAYLLQIPFAPPGLRFEQVNSPTGRMAVRGLDLIDTGTH